MSYRAGRDSAMETTTTNGTINLGPGNNQNATYTGSTGDMASRSGQSVATLNVELLANDGVAYWSIASTEIVATDTIAATCTTEWCPVTVYHVVAGSFLVAVTNSTGGNINKDATLTVNWAAL
jgi:hypothetical protein